jgi:hypothetical protein
LPIQKAVIDAYLDEKQWFGELLKTQSIIPTEVELNPLNIQEHLGVKQQNLNKLKILHEL